MIYCFNCGKSIPADSKVCTFCGAAVPAIVTEEPLVRTIKSRPYYFADHRGDFIRSAGFWGSLLVLVAFFLPWIHNVANPTGLDIVNHGHKADRFALLVFPLCALLILLDSLTNFLPSGAAILFKVLPFLLLLVIIALLIINKKHPATQELNVSMNDFKSLIKNINIGLWLTIAGAVVLLFHKKYKRI